MVNPWNGLGSLVARIRRILDDQQGPARRRLPPLRRARLQLESLEVREVLSTTPLSASALSSLFQSAAEQNEQAPERGGVLVEFTNGSIRYSSDYANLGGGGESVGAYDADAQKLKLLALPKGGVLAQNLTTHAVFYSPDGTRLTGGGNTVQVYDGAQGALKLVWTYKGGVFAQVQSTGAVFYSPDYKNLVGGGLTAQVYNGSQGAVKLTALVQGGALVQFDNNKLFYSEDYKNLAGGGKTTQVYDGSLGAATLTRTYDKGVFVRFANSNAVFYSEDYKNLAGGGKTTRVYDGAQGAVKLVALQNGKGVLTQLNNNAVFLSTDYKNLAAVTGNTTRVYDGAGGAVVLFAVKGGGVLVQSPTDQKVYFSADAKNLTAAANVVYDGSQGAVELKRINGGGVYTRVVATNVVYYSPDFKNLVGGGNTKKVYDGASGQLQQTITLYAVKASGLVTVTSPTGLKHVELKVGTGAAAKAGDRLKVHYTGWLDDGTKFDSSLNAGRHPFIFKIGQNPAEVIKGWEEGILGMQVGGVRKLIIPANLGYGSQATGSIPANSRLTFEVKLLEINPNTLTPNVTTAVTTEDAKNASGLVITPNAADGTQVKFFKITGITGGTLFQSDGTTAIAEESFITTAQGQAGLKFLPAADANGPAGGTFRFNVQSAVDSAGTALSPTPAVATVVVSEVNDDPVPGNNSLSAINEDSGPLTIPFSTLLQNDTTGPANESAQTLTITAVANAVGGSVAINGTDVVFTPDANFHGPASFTYTVQDNGTTNGTTNAKTGTGNVTFTINPVADAPQVTAATTSEGTATNSGLVITPSADDGAEVTHYKVSAITGGTLFQNDGTTPINDGDFITRAEGAAGLVFVPAADANTPAGDTFSFVVQAALDAQGAGLSTGTTASITVSEVNDAPTAGDDTLADVAENSAAFTIAFSTLLADDSAGANEDDQVITIIAISNVVGGSAVIVGTDIVFSPDANYTGVAGFDYTIQDNGTTDGAAAPLTDTGSVSFNIV